MASSYVGGLSGAFIPVSEDAGMIDAAADGRDHVRQARGDDVRLLGRPRHDRGARRHAGRDDRRDHRRRGRDRHDQRKTTAVRIIPAPGKKVGDVVSFGGLLGRAPVMALHRESSAAFVARGGRIPAPLQALNN